MLGDELPLFANELGILLELALQGELPDLLGAGVVALVSWEAARLAERPSLSGERGCL